MEPTVGSAGTRWDTTAEMPIVAATLPSASSTGMPAAISAPKASSISSSVTGRLIPSAEDRSSATWSLIASSRLSPPVWRIDRSGCSAATASVTLGEGTDVVDPVGEGDRHEHRGAVVVPDRRCHLAHPLGARHLPRDLAGGVGHRGRVPAQQHELGVRRGQSGPLRQGVRAAGVADAVVGGLGLVRRHQHREAGGGRHQHEPGEDRAPRVLGAPARGPLGDPGDQVGCHRRAPFVCGSVGPLCRRTGRPPRLSRSAWTAGVAPPAPRWGKPHRRGRRDR